MGLSMKLSPYTSLSMASISVVFKTMTEHSNGFPKHKDAENQIVLVFHTKKPTKEADVTL